MTSDGRRSPVRARRYRSSERYRDAPYMPRQNKLCNNCKRPGHLGRDCANQTVCNNFMLLLSATLMQHAGTANSLVTSQMNAATILCATFVATLATYLVIVPTPASPLVAQGYATTASSLATYPSIAPMKRPVITAINQATLLGTACLILYVTFALSLGTWPVIAQGQA